MKPPSRNLVARDEESNSPSVLKGTGKRTSDFVYPTLTRFCYTAQELHEVHGLSLDGMLPQQLGDHLIPESEWLSVFKVNHKKGTKIFLHMLHPQFVDECRLLYHKVYQASPPNNELTARFAKGFAYENCQAAKADPEGHKIAWAVFGENVLKMVQAQPGGLARKLKNWRKANEVQSTDNINQETPCGRPQVAEEIHDCGGHLGIAEAMLATVQARLALKKEACNTAKEQYECKRDATMRAEGAASKAAAIFLSQLQSLQHSISELRAVANPNVGEVNLKEAQMQLCQKGLVLCGQDEGNLVLMKQDLQSSKKRYEAAIAELAEIYGQFQFAEALVHQIKLGEIFTIVPRPPSPKLCEVSIISVEGNCVACGLPLETGDVIGIYMLACRHKYHPLCFASVCKSRLSCVRIGCSQWISQNARQWVSRHNASTLGSTNGDFICKGTEFYAHKRSNSSPRDVKVTTHVSQPTVGSTFDATAEEMPVGAEVLMHLQYAVGTDGVATNSTETTVGMQSDDKTIWRKCDTMNAGGKHKKAKIGLLDFK